jgi:hypothetical protein
VCPSWQCRPIRYTRQPLRSYESAAEDEKEQGADYTDIIKRAFVDAAAQLTGRQVQLDAGSADSDAESVESSRARTRNAPGRTLTPTHRARSTSGSRTRYNDHVPVSADLLLRTLAASGTRMISDTADGT